MYFSTYRTPEIDVTHPVMHHSKSKHRHCQQVKMNKHKELNKYGRWLLCPRKPEQPRTSEGTGVFEIPKDPNRRQKWNKRK